MSPDNRRVFLSKKRISGRGGWLWVESFEFRFEGELFSRHRFFGEKKWEYRKGVEYWLDEGRGRKVSRLLVNIRVLVRFIFECRTNIDFIPKKLMQSLISARIIRLLIFLYDL